MTLTVRHLRLALWCANEELRARAAGKLPGVQAWNADLVRALELELAVSQSGHRDDGGEEDWDPQAWMTAAETAVVLGMSKRHVNRIAESLGCKDIGGRRLFPAASVNEYAEGRRDVRPLTGS